MQRLGGHTGTVTQVTMGDGNFMASASNDQTIIVSELPDIFLWSQKQERQLLDCYQFDYSN